jgi:TolB-like protein/Tfp pilus assembly protein PilF
MDRTLAGEGDDINEYAIGLDVFEKPASFDTRIDSSVRAEVSRLRRALSEYYEQAGRDDLWRVELPRRGYSVIFTQVPVAGTPLAAPPAQARARKRMLWIALAALAAAIAGVAMWRIWPNQAIRSVVVLPFNNMTGDASQDYIADGVTEELTDSLARVPDLRVVARTSAFQFKGKGIDVRQVGRELNVDAAVEGSIRWIDGHLRLTVQVNRTRDGYHILSRSFEGGTGELGRIERDMAQPVHAVLRPGSALPNRHVPSGEAREFFVKAKPLGEKEGTQEGFEHSVAYLNRAIQSDPSYADAYAALAGVYVSAAVNFASEPLQHVPAAKAAAAKALELDPLCGRAYGALGFLDGLVLLDWKRAEQELRHAISLIPQDAVQHGHLGITLMAQGRFPEALKELRTAESLDPLLAAAGTEIGLALYCARRYDDALRQFTKVVQLHPDAIAVHPFFGPVYEAKGEYRKAMAEYELSPNTPDTKARIAHLLAVGGKREQARRMLNELEHPAAGQPLPDAFNMAVSHAALGENDRAVEWLERAYEARNIALLKVHPMLDPLRGDPRFAKLLNRAGLGGD